MRYAYYPRARHTMGTCPAPLVQQQRQEWPLPQLFLVADKQMSSGDGPPASPAQTDSCLLTGPTPGRGWVGLRGSCKRCICVSRRPNDCSEGRPRWCKFPAGATAFGVNGTRSEKKPLPEEESSLEPRPLPHSNFLSLEAGLCSSSGCLGNLLLGLSFKAETHFVSKSERRDRLWEKANHLGDY